jgi:Protein of unknown function (DUF2591)
MLSRKTSELTGAALDWAVAKCEHDWLSMKAIQYPSYVGTLPIPTPSTDWAQGGPIIERESIDIARFDTYPDWKATMNETDANPFTTTIGPTPLIAAMRCYVASKLGEEVEVPEELS